MTGTQKTDDVYKLMDSQKTHEYEVTGAHKKIDVYKLMDSQKTREYELTGAQKTDTSHFNHGAHHASKAKHKRNHTSEQSASSKTANSQ